MIFQETKVKDVLIKTIILPIPGAYETTIIGGMNSGDKWNDGTEQEAIKTHATAVELVRITG